MRTLLFSLAILTLTLTAARTTVSFDCITRSPEESFKAADVVFDGEVIRITRVDQNPQYTFRVDYRLKGLTGREVTILGGQTNCDATFGPNTIYRVYAKYYNGKLTSGVCSGNKVLRIKK
jgi:hypothetical protein